MKLSPVPSLSVQRLRRAAEAGHLFLTYQPKLDLRTGAICGVEALARWHDPKLGVLPPALFIPATEQLGIIHWITEWALNTAIDQWSEWLSNDLDLDLSTNISALDLEDVSFPDQVAMMCKRASVPCERLMLELTEGATQQAIPLMDTISRLRLKGIGISLDDFGTGYGSLLQLRQLPFTELKLDRTFVDDLQSSRESRAIVRSLIALSHELGLTVTGEGVEDFQTLQMLAAFGCDRAQGYYIAQAMPADQVGLWMRKQTEREERQAI